MTGMRYAIGIVGIGALLLGLLSTEARAQSGIVLWDQHIASAMNDLLLRDDPCYGAPQSGLRVACSRHSLNLTLVPRVQPLTALDEIALLAHRVYKVNMVSEITRRTKIRLRADLDNLHNREAMVQLSLSFRF